MRFASMDTITITQAQGFDAWGDICRTYSTTDTTSNKFTGKERDQETGYDYFGARYYDSRIGRWLQTEPLYDKYLQYSPYCYGLVNPLKIRDIQGFYPKITVTDNVIHIDFNFYYVPITSDPNFGLNEEQINIANELLNNMASKWSIPIKFNNKEYSVDVSVKLNEVKRNFDDIEEELYNNKEYFNMIISLDDENTRENKGIGVNNHCALVLNPTKKIVPYKNTGAHELGHLLYLSDEDYISGVISVNNFNKSYSELIIVNSIMGPIVWYKGEDMRLDPSNYDWNLIINNENNNHLKNLLK